jgi:hypothetical protein
VGAVVRSRRVPVGRWAGLVGAIILVVEAFGIAWVHWFLGMVVDRQDMSLAGLDPHAMSISTRIMGLLFGLYLATCGFVLLRAALRDRSPSRFGRILLITAAVVHGLLGALSVGLVGWSAFAFMMVVLGLILLTLMTYDDGAARTEPTDAPGGSSSNGSAEGGTPQPA